MQRLFVALEIPDAIKAQLLDLQQAAPPGCRLVPHANLHLTLAFIGKAELAHVQHVLKPIRHPPVELTTDAPGCFSRGKGTTFWVGFRLSTGLLSLQNHVQTRLREASLIAPDDKAFQPHVTLARCNKRIRSGDRQMFLSQQLPHPPTLFPADHFILYSSETLPEGPVYRVEARYPLIESG